MQRQNKSIYFLLMFIGTPCYCRCYKGFKCFRPSVNIVNIKHKGLIQGVPQNKWQLDIKSTFYKAVQFVMLIFPSIKFLVKYKIKMKKQC